MKTPQEVIAKLNDAKNGIYSAAELECVWVPNEMLPESYHDNREGGKSLDRLQRVVDSQQVKEEDPREKSVVISHGEIMHGNNERIEILNRYRDAVEADYENFPDSVGEEDFYVENEDRLYRNQLVFAEVIGLDLEDEDGFLDIADESISDMHTTPLKAHGREKWEK